MIPIYSLTGDLLNYARCPLQYRYFTRPGIRESHPAQRWYGQFLHRGMRLAYDQWRDGSVAPEAYKIGNEAFRALEQQVRRTLRAEGLFQPGNVDATAEGRLLRAIRLLGSQLFPVIDRSEVRLNAVRECSAAASGLYQVTGVIDVLAVARFGEPGANLLVDIIRDRLEEAGHDLGDVGEVIVDYKGVSREHLDQDALEAARNQILTYGWLRNREAGDDVVSAGVLCMVDDLLPHGSDPDQTPTGAAARQLLDASLVVLPVSRQTIAAGTDFFDTTVAQIENALREESDDNLPATWAPRPEHRTCAACDARWHCPASDLEYGAPEIRPLAPRAP